MANPSIDLKKLDVLQAQINVSVAQARDLVNSWLPPVATGNSRSPYSAAPQDNDDDLLKPMPARLGLGAPVPAHFYDDDQKLRKDISTTDLLKRRLLGSKRNASQLSEKPAYSKVKQNGKPLRAGSESEEEEGRSSLGKSKRQKLKEENTEDDDIIIQEKVGDPMVNVQTSGANEGGEKKSSGREEGKTKVNDSSATVPKPTAANGAAGAHEMANKKKQKKKKKNRQNVEPPAQPNPNT